MTKTNDFNQPIDEKGKTLTTTELIYADLDKLLGRKLTKAELTAAARYVIEREYEDWYSGYKQGLVAGQKDVVTMLEAVVEQKSAWRSRGDGDSEGAVPVFELQKVIKAVKKTKEGNT